MPRAASASATAGLVSPFKFISNIARSMTCASIAASAFSTVAAATTDSHPRSAKMSSIIIKTSNSSSTTRPRRSASNLLITITSWRRKSHRADQTVRLIVEMHRTFEFMGDTALDHPRAEPSMRWWRDGRAVLLLPPQEKLAALYHGLHRPLDEDGPRRIGKRTVFHRIGREFIERYTKDQ